MLTPIVDGICRAEGARLLAGLIRRFGDFELAEDAMQDAFAKALEVWPAEGLPAAPAAWLTTVARNRALDLLRRRATGPLYTDEPPDMAAPEAGAEEAIDGAAHSGVEDDRLRLVFTCCHPALAQPAQVALALRTLCGLSTREIARAFLEPEATTAQRLVRAKRKIQEAAHSLRGAGARAAAGAAGRRARRRLPGLQRRLRRHRRRRPDASRPVRRGDPPGATARAADARRGRDPGPARAHAAASRAPRHPHRGRRLARAARGAGAPALARRRDRRRPGRARSGARPAAARSLSIAGRDRGAARRGAARRRHRLAADRRALPAAC